MTVYTEDGAGAIAGYYRHLKSNGWCSFEDQPPYAHWLIEVAEQLTQDKGDIIRPIANNNGRDEIYKYWRPAIFGRSIKD